MAQQIVNIGTVANDGTGDTLRDGGDKINDNFTELYALVTAFGGSWKTPVRAASTANGTLATAFENGDTLDGVTLATGDRILLKNQTSAAENGIYVVNASGAPTRASDADSGAELVNAAVLVSEGTANADKLFISTTNAPITIGSTSITFIDPFASAAVNWATPSEVNGGSVANKAIDPDTLAGSNFGTAVATILVSDPAGSAITTGDGKAYYPVPSTMNGMDLVSAKAFLITASSSGIPTIQIANVTQAVDMLTTKLTIDASELTSATAATPAVIDTGNDDVATGDILRIDIDVAGTGAKGLIVELQFRLP